MIVSKGILPYRLLTSKPYSLRSILLFALILGLVLHLRYSLWTLISEETVYVSNAVTASHPIERLINQNYGKHQQFLARQSRTPEEAIANYKRRYSRDPPAGYTKWVEFALKENSAVIDDFDIINERLEPFRGVPASELRKRIQSFRDNADAYETFKVANGTIVEATPEYEGHLKAVIPDLPDVEVLITWLDEPRIIGHDREATEVKVLDLGHKSAWKSLTDKCNFNSEKRSWVSASSSKSYPRFVDNPKKELDICSHPEYEKMHGIFNSPSNFRAITALVPFLSTTSASTMNDILTPGLDYVGGDYLGDPSKGDKIPYAEKKSKMYWKGWSTGSFFDEASWKYNHRVQFVQKFEKKEMFNVGFSRFVQCEGDFCNKMEEYVGLVPLDPPTVGFEYKFAMDMDGNGYSGRYYRLLQSNCLVFKQTMFEQWHDNRLFPWVHYIPVSMSLDELEAAVDYFANDLKGQVYGERIAHEGQEWGKKVLRPVDMTIYNYRLLLEYAQLFKDAELLD